jgi:hypothetical protein
MSIFEAYEKPGWTGGGEPWIDFKVEISRVYRHDLVNHILEFGKTNKYLSGIIYNNGWTFTLPKTSEFNQKERIIELTLKDDDLIVGINTKDKSPLLVNEVDAFRTCFESYNLIYLEKKRQEAENEQAEKNSDRRRRYNKYLKYKTKYINLKNSLKNNF